MFYISKKLNFLKVKVKYQTELIYVNIQILGDMY